METQTWRMQFCCRDDDLRLRGRSNVADARKQFARQVYKGINRLLTFQEVPGNYRVDAILYRTFGEVPYVERLEAVTANQLARWRQRIINSPTGVIVTNRAIMFDRAQIVAEFRYLRKTGEYWSYVKDERRFRSLYGQAIPYQCLTHLHLRKLSRQQGWIKLHRLFGRIEVPRGCYVELPPAFSYVWREMMEDENSGWLVVIFTEFTCKVASFILQDVYDNYRLWALSSDTIRCLRGLDLVGVLGNQENVDELHRLLDVIDSTNFNQLPESWRQRGERMHDYSPGRVGPGADWMYYDPWARRTVTEAVARQKAEEPRIPVPEGHPTGFDFDFPAAGWNVDNTAFVAAQGTVDEDEEGDEAPLGWEGDVEVDEVQPAVTTDGGNGNNTSTTTAAVTPTASGFSTVPSHPGFVPSAGQPAFAIAQPAQVPMVSQAIPFQGVGPGQVLNPGLFPYNPYAIEAVKQFLREVGVEEGSLGNSWAELRMYMRGRLE